MDTARLANYVQDVPERYVPGLMRGELVEAEHLCRYVWASALAKSRRVLDAGCGMAYGSAILARAGASEVTGVDIAPAILDAARPTMPAAVGLEVADVRKLPFGDGDFDLVVCFEVIEHVEDPEVILEELARVTAPGGLLLVSSPNRDVYPSDNPHHLRELTPEELGAALTRHFRHVELLAQHPWSASLITPAAAIGDELTALERCHVYRTGGIEPGAEAYSVALASDSALPALDDVLVLAGDLEFRRWVELFDGQSAHISKLEVELNEARTTAAERAEIRRELLAAEQLLAELPNLREQRERDARLINALSEEVNTLSQELEQGRRSARVVEDLKASVSWRITAPLRAAKRLLDGSRR